MSDKYSLQDLAEIVESEGLEYAISGYVTPSKIEDDEMRKLWKQCKELLQQIEDKLGNLE